MNKISVLTLVAMLGIAPLVASCGTSEVDSSTATTAVATAETTAATADTTATTATVAADAPARGNGGPGGSDPSSVTTLAALDALIQSAYGDAPLGLHRGHQPVEAVLIEVLGITHDEMHVRMDAGQNLGAIAEDLGIEPDTLITALVDSWSVAIDNVVTTGAITDAQAAEYLDALTEAFTYRVTWNGADATPTFAGIA